MDRVLNAIALTVASLAVLGIAMAWAALDVSGWKTYRNSKIGLEFRYPAEYAPTELATPDGRPIAIHLQAGDWSVEVSVNELIYESLRGQAARGAEPGGCRRGCAWSGGCCGAGDAES